MIGYMMKSVIKISIFLYLRIFSAIEKTSLFGKKYLSKGSSLSSLLIHFGLKITPFQTFFDLPEFLRIFGTT